MPSQNKKLERVENAKTPSYALSILVLLGVGFYVLYFVAGVPALYTGIIPPFGAPHAYNDPTKEIRAIRVDAFYFVPKDKITEEITNWENVLKENLESLKQFHEAQFLSRSRLTYAIFPEVIVGREDAQAYNIELSNHTDPSSLTRITEELHARVFLGEGDHYHSAFAGSAEDAYRVMLILYEGRGAAGAGSTALVSRALVTVPENTAFAATFFAHEFYHTLGVPDGYRTYERAYIGAPYVQAEVLAEEDVMGRVRIPLSQTYIHSKTLRAMGI